MKIRLDEKPFTLLTQIPAFTYIVAPFSSYLLHWCVSWRSLQWIPTDSTNFVGVTMKRALLALHIHPNCIWKFFNISYILCHFFSSFYLFLKREMHHFSHQIIWFEISFNSKIKLTKMRTISINSIRNTDSAILSDFPCQLRFSLYYSKACFI